MMEPSCRFNLYKVVHSDANRALLHLCTCTTIHRYPNLSTRYPVMCKVYTGYHCTSEIEPNLCACTIDNALAKARGLSPNYALFLTCAWLRMVQEII